MSDSVCVKGNSCSQVMAKCMDRISIKTPNPKYRFYWFLIEFIAVLGIRIRNRIRMFLGLPDPDPLVRGADPDPDPTLLS